LRNNVDLAFPKHVKGVDLVLGGHDHVILEQVREGTAVIKSGTNFNHIGLIKLYSKDHVTEHLGNRVNYDWKIEKITPAASVDV
jgi:2',3'-cyclic-nucleotide 2'-phosphodiesterase (5'-nucleotidase family)